MAQENIKQKEIGLTFKSLSNFGLTFKTGSDSSLWRFNSLLMSGYNRHDIKDSLVRKRSHIGFNIKLGREYRKMIAENIELRYGADISFEYHMSKYDYNDKSISDHDILDISTTYESGINLVFGFNYVLNGNLVIGAELLPYFSYTIDISKEKNYYHDYNEEKEVISGFNYGLSNTPVLLSVAYRF